MRWLPLPTLALLVSACGSAPPPAQPIANRDTTGLKERVDAVEKAVDADDTEERIRENSAALTRLEEQARVAESRLAAMPAPPPPPPKRPSRPDPDAVYAVPIAGSPYEGPKVAWVTMVVATEFLCPFCERIRPTMDELRADYGKDLKIVYKQYIVHPSATEAALSICAAGKQGNKKFKRLYDLFWDEAYKANRNFATTHLEGLATKAKLKLKRFRRDRDGDCKDILEADRKMLAAVGLRGVPAFYINGRHLSGARPKEQFVPLIDEELARAKKSKIKKAKYYKHILDTGKTSM